MPNAHRWRGWRSRERRPLLRQWRRRLDGSMHSEKRYCTLPCPARRPHEERLMKLRRSIRVLVPFTVFFALFGYGNEDGSQTNRPPWRMEWADRMDLRFSASEQARRAGEYSSMGLKHIVNGNALMIEGSLSPDLFTPREIFSQLIATAFANDQNIRQFWRDLYARGTELPNGESGGAFWVQLEEAARPLLTVTHPYVQDKDDRRRLGAATATDPITICRLRAIALDRARRAFPEYAFEMFLYQSVAPHMAMSTTANPAELLYLEEGCT